MTAVRTPRRIAPTTVCRAFGEDRAHPAVLGKIVGIDGGLPLASLAGGRVVAVHLDDTEGFTRALSRPDLCRVEGHELLVMVNAYYGLIGLAVGPAMPPTRIAVDFSAHRLQGGSVVGLDGDDEHPSWLLFACEVIGIGGQGGKSRAVPEDEATKTEAAIGDALTIEACLQRLARRRPVRAALVETFGDLAVLKTAGDGQSLSHETARHARASIEGVFGAHGKEVLCLAWDGLIPGSGGAVWVTRYADLYLVTSSDYEPQGPFVTLGDALLCDMFMVTTSNPELSSTVLTTKDLVSIAAGVVDWENAGTIWINETEFSVDGTALKPAADVASPPAQLLDSAPSIPPAESSVRSGEQSLRASDPRWAPGWTRQSRPVREEDELAYRRPPKGVRRS